MSDGDAGEADALSRLEAALDRIAMHSQRPGRAAESGPTVDAGMVAARLDALIGTLRDGLAGEA